MLEDATIHLIEKIFHLEKFIKKVADYLNMFDFDSCLQLEVINKRMLFSQDFTANYFPAIVSLFLDGIAQEWLI